MELKFTKAQMCKVLEKYYQEQEGIKGKVTIKGHACNVGYEMCSYRDVLVDMKIEGEIVLDGMRLPLEKEIPTSDLQAAFTHFLSELNQEVESVSFDKGISYHTEGYYMSERTVEKPYFKGVIVKLKNKTKKIGGM
ncbi:MAG: hypothetical protein HFE81_05595 [Bacilli bacterium]|nr:hypothetical protein [Bacilli bacterium]